MEAFALYIVSIISKFGYFGIFVGMTIESSFIPFPSEIIMIPAGYLVYKGEMNLFLAILTGTLGSITGALVNYYLASSIGKPILEKYGRYFLVSPKSLSKAENFFIKHGEISTLSGRLLPGIRQLISIPAGLIKMPLPKFIFLTLLGSCIWVIILTVFGYFLGQNQENIIKYMPYIKIGSIIFALTLIFGYIIYKRKK
jgi:membrane protein DedA with SNARE-associated domain